MQVDPLIVLVLSLCQWMNGELGVCAVACPERTQCFSPGLSAATAEHGELRSKQRWLAILYRTVRTHSKVDLSTLRVRQSRAIVQFLTWERILLKTGTEVAYPIRTNNAAGCP